MKYYLIAGEASGDIYGAKLIQSIKQIDSSAEFRFWGGDNMLQESPNLAVHHRDTAFMGFWEVAKNMGTIRKLFAFCKKDILAFKPDVLICIDYPGFNLRMTKWAKKQGIATVYYIAPQLWAWKKSRYKTIDANVDLLFVILPFEQGFYKGLGIQAHYFGHPLASEIQEKTHNNIGENHKNIALLPGSRHQEIKHHLPILIDFCKARHQNKFTIAFANGTKPESYLNQNDLPSNLNIEIGKTREVLQASDLAIVSSGTATLETALIGTPQVVIYKTSQISYQIGKRLVKLPWISLVNIIAGKAIVEELIQGDLNVTKLGNAINAISEAQQYDNIKQSYRELRDGLEVADGVMQVAEKIVKYLQ